MLNYAFISSAADKVVKAFPESVNFPAQRSAIVPYIEKYVRGYYAAMGHRLADDTVLEIALTIYRRPNR
jgi:hypothetical protein